MSEGHTNPFDARSVGGTLGGSTPPTTNPPQP